MDITSSSAASKIVDPESYWTPNVQTGLAPIVGKAYFFGEEGLELVDYGETKCLFITNEPALS